MRLVFMGTPDFASPSLQNLHQSAHQVVAVITGQDKPVGRGEGSRGRRVAPPPVKRQALDLGYPVLQPARLKDAGFQSQLADMAADVFVVVAFRILPDSLLAIPSRGAVNLHPSLLPRYRGAAPIQHCLLAGDTITGVTTTMMSMRIDAGNILLQQEHAIQPRDDFGSLSLRLAQIGAELLTATLDGLDRGAITPRPQPDLPPGETSPAPKITPGDLVIDWDRPAQAIANQIRAFAPRPGAATFWNGQRLKLFKAHATVEDGKPGVIHLVGRDRLQIGTASGTLEVEELQLEGRQRLSVDAFLRGVELKSGTFLG